MFIGHKICENWKLKISDKGYILSHFIVLTVNFLPLFPVIVPSSATVSIVDVSTSPQPVQSIKSVIFRSPDGNNYEQKQLLNQLKTYFILIFTILLTNLK